MRHAAALAALIAIPSIAQAREKATPRPEPFTYGLGGGISVPAERITPNTASLRLRLGEHLALEPTVVAQGEEQESDPGEGGTDKEGTSAVAFGADFRVGFAERGPVDGVLLAGIGVSTARQEDRPSGDDNDTSIKGSGYYVAAGLGTEYWINRHISWSVDGLLLSYVGAKAEIDREGQDDDEEPSFTQSARGITTTPTLRMMIHLYL